MTEMLCSEAGALMADLLDGEGEIAAAARARFDRHLARCRACRDLMHDLSAIRATARQLPPIPPPEAVWDRLSSRLRAADRSAAPRLGAAWQPDWLAAWSPWRLAVAASLLVAVGVTAALTVRSLTSVRPPAAPATGYLAVLDDVEAELAEAEQHYEAALRGLARLAELEDEPVAADAAALREHLMLLDQVIAESRAALRQQPDSRPAERSLFEGVRRKFVLLRDAYVLLDDLQRRDGSGAAATPQ